MNENTVDGSALCDFFKKLNLKVMKMLWWREPNLSFFISIKPFILWWFDRQSQSQPIMALGTFRERGGEGKHRGQKNSWLQLHNSSIDLLQLYNSQVGKECSTSHCITGGSVNPPQNSASYISLFLTMSRYSYLPAAAAAAVVKVAVAEAAKVPWAQEVTQLATRTPTLGGGGVRVRKFSSLCHPV